MSKEKTFDEKIKELRGKEGVIKLSDADKKAFVEGEERYIEKESDEMDKYMWFLVGIGMGILGNFIVALFYDWAKSQGGWRFGLLSFGLILLFIMLCYISFNQLREYKRNIDFAYKSQKTWPKVKSLKVGPTVRAYNRDEWKELQENLKRKKNGSKQNK